MNNQTDAPMLRIRGLTKSFPLGSFHRKSICVVNNVDLDVNSEEIRGIVGESGAGKSTLVRCSLRLIEPSSGSIQFNGEELTLLSPASLRAKRREFQMIFQDPYASLNPYMTVEQIMMGPLQVHKIGDREFKTRRVREMLEVVSLSESIMNRKSSELSGGQQQRVGIARGLILNPRLLIADEPVSSLDASVQAQILNLMAELKKRYSLTMILISHSLSAIHYLCTHISVLYRGRLIEDAPADVFFRKPKHPYSQSLLNATPVLDPIKPHTVRSATMTSTVRQDARSGCAYYPFCSHKLPICEHQAPFLSEVKKGETVACFLHTPE
jgi:peptide/nickel transport system ATP-binding protein/oligopeptide transport system ATP-binding protein